MKIFPYTDVKYYGRILDVDIITHNENDITVIEESAGVRRARPFHHILRQISL